MTFEDILAVISPRMATRRLAEKAVYAQMRGFAAAKRGRLQANLRNLLGSADAILNPDLETLRARSRQMERDNPMASSAIRVLTNHIVGDGIAARAIHSDPKIAKLGQAAWDRFATSKVCGNMDYYGVQKLSVRTTIASGDCLNLWGSKDGIPNSTIMVLEGDQLDHRLTRQEGKKRYVQGVEYDEDGDRVGYHLFESHPNDVVGPRYSGNANAGQTKRIDAKYIDHLYEILRPGQTRGVPWLYPVISRLMDLDELDKATLTKKKVEACLSVFRTAADDGTTSALAPSAKQENGDVWETLSPGMIINGRAGEHIEVINPSSTGDSDVFKRGMQMNIAAALGLPYHMLTGDVSQANYSSLRASIVVFWQALDNWIHHTVTPQLCDPAFARIMDREATLTGVKALREVRAKWTPPPRAWVDPLRDFQAQVAEARAFPGSMLKMLAERGMTLEDAVADQAMINAAFTDNAIASDADPRRVNGSGSLQPTAGYLATPAP